MKLNKLIIILTIFLIYDTYYDNIYIKNIKTYTKYYKMLVITIFGFGLYVMTTKTNNKSDIVKYVNKIPIDNNIKKIIKPCINNFNHEVNSDKRINETKTKRSVSETKKKYIASNQDWKCKKCKNKLSAWFEVDHVIRLENGGSNEITNLEALCRECHGEKTALEKILI
jgi:5-methylcytosine-specific restriction enzyme A